jgi:hypothetical protein
MGKRRIRRFAPAKARRGFPLAWRLERWKWAACYGSKRPHLLPLFSVLKPHPRGALFPVPPILTSIAGPAATSRMTPLPRLLASARAALIRPNCGGRHCFLLVIPLVFDATTSIWHHHGRIRSRALLSWPLGTARRAVRRGRECRRSGLQRWGSVAMPSFSSAMRLPGCCRERGLSACARSLRRNGCHGTRRGPVDGPNASRLTPPRCCPRFLPSRCSGVSMLKKISDDPAAAAAEARKKNVQAIENVFENLGLDAKEGWDVLRQVAANLGHPIGGRPKGTKKWDNDRLIVLGANLDEIELKYPNANDEKLARQIKNEWPDDYKYENPNSLRKRLPMARRIFKELMKSPVLEQFSASLLRVIIPPELLNLDEIQAFREAFPSSAHWVGVIIKAAAPVRRAEARRRRKSRRD